MNNKCTDSLKYIKDFFTSLLNLESRDRLCSLYLELRNCWTDAGQFESYLIIFDNMFSHKEASLHNDINRQQGLIEAQSLKLNFVIRKTDYIGVVMIGHGPNCCVRNLHNFPKFQQDTVQTKTRLPPEIFNVLIFVALSQWFLFVFLTVGIKSWHSLIRLRFDILCTN